MRGTVLVLLYLAYCMVQAVRVGNDPIGRKLSPVCVPSLVASERASSRRTVAYLLVCNLPLAAARTDHHRRVKRGWWDGRTRGFSMTA